MRSLVYFLMGVVIAVVVASLTVEVYGKCPEGWWWKGKNWCAIDYTIARLQPLEAAAIAKVEPPPAEKSKAPAKKKKTPG